MAKNNIFFIQLMLFFALAIATYFLFSDGLSQQATRSEQALWDMGHVLYFILFSHALFQIKPLKSLNFLRLSLIVLSLTLGFGILIELLQYGTARQPDSWDVAHDILGSLLALAFHPAVRSKANKLFKFLTVTMFVISLYPLIIAIVDERIASLQFPVLADFSTPLEYQRFSKTQLKSQSKNGLKIDFSTDQYSGISMQYFEHDWSAYDVLNIEMNNSNAKPMALSIKIHDQKHTETYDFNDRYNGRLTLKPGNNLIAINLSDIKHAPNNRSMNMNNIFQIQIFSVSFDEPQSIYLTSIYLSKH